MARPPSNRRVIADELERASARLDQLIGQARLGVASHRQYDAMEEEAQAIAGQLIGAFRGAPVAAPLAIARRGDRTLAIF